MKVWFTSRCGFEKLHGPRTLRVVSDEADLGFPISDGVDDALGVRESNQGYLDPAGALEFSSEIHDNPARLTSHWILAARAGFGASKPHARFRPWRADSFAPQLTDVIANAISMSANCLPMVVP